MVFFSVSSDAISNSSFAVAYLLVRLVGFWG